MRRVIVAAFDRRVCFLNASFKEVGLVIFAGFEVHYLWILGVGSSRRGHQASSSEDDQSGQESASWLLGCAWGEKSAMRASRSLAMRLLVFMYENNNNINNKKWRPSFGGQLLPMPSPTLPCVLACDGSVGASSSLRKCLDLGMREQRGGRGAEIQCTFSPALDSLEISPEKRTPTFLNPCSLALFFCTLVDVSLAPKTKSQETKVIGLRDEKKSA